MILIDFTQTIIAGLMAQLKMNDGEINEDMLRQITVNDTHQSMVKLFYVPMQVILGDENTFHNTKQTVRRQEKHLIWIGNLSSTHCRKLKMR